MHIHKIFGAWLQNQNIDELKYFFNIILSYEWVKAANMNISPSILNQ